MFTFSGPGVRQWQFCVVVQSNLLHKLNMIALPGLSMARIVNSLAKIKLRVSRTESHLPSFTSLIAITSQRSTECSPRSTTESDLWPRSTAILFTHISTIIWQICLNSKSRRELRRPPEARYRHSQYSIRQIIS